jgi:small subunit ribosomal protein S7e
MYTARKKIQKEKGLEPSEFEDSVAQVSRAPIPRHLCSPLRGGSFAFLISWASRRSDAFVATSQAFFDLENSNQELKSDLKDLYINNAM